MKNTLNENARILKVRNEYLFQQGDDPKDTTGYTFKLPHFYLTLLHKASI